MSKNGNNHDWNTGPHWPSGNPYRHPGGRSGCKNRAAILLLIIVVIIGGLVSWIF